MRALQLHYTSCRKGQSGNAGFQTRASTPGLRPDEQREVERRGVYRPPRDASQEPTPEEIDRDFPRAFRYYSLESGRRALTLCRYTGRDYSGRWGNFFAHTLVLENGEEPPLWPIDYYEWSGWQERLGPDEDTEQPPPPLPHAELDGTAAAESFRFEELREFLREQPGRPELLAKMGRAVLSSRQTSRAVVIRDSATNGLYWTACLQKLFPRPHAWSLTISTYQDDPRGCAAINATTGETDFSFEESERRYRFYMFDLTTGLHSDVPDSADDYPARAARWMAEDPGLLERFYSFMRLFEHRQPEPDLVFALNLFELSTDQGKPPEGDRLAAMIAFASRHATAEGRAELLDLLGRAVERSGGLTRAEDFEILIRFLAEGARSTGRPQHRALVFSAWRLLLRKLLTEGQGLESAESTWGTLHQHLSGHASELAELVLAEPLHGGAADLGKLPPEILTFLLRVTWSCLDLASRSPAWSQLEIAQIADALAGRAEPVRTAQGALEAIPRQAEALAGFGRLLAERWTQARSEKNFEIRIAIGRALGRALASGTPQTAADARRLLDNRNTWEILLGEWVEILNRERDPKAAYAEYRRSVMAVHAEYEQRWGSWIASCLLKRLPETERASLALTWLRDREIDRFSEELTGECLALANSAVPLDPDAEGGGETARLVAESAARLGRALQPDRPALRKALTAARTPHTTLKDLSLAEIRKAVPALQPNEYADFLSVFLQPALERTENFGDHQKVLLAVWSPQHRKVLEKSYLAFFKSQPGNPRPEPLQVALKFWLLFDRGREEMSCLAPLEETARDGLVLALEKLKPKKLDALRLNLGKARLDVNASARFQEIEAALEKRRQGPWARLAGVFARR